MQTNTEQFDIVIVGGGLVGCSMAGALKAQAAGQNLKIAIIESSVKPELSASHHSSKSSFDGKAIALSYGSVQQLDNWALWQAVKPFTQAINKIEVSEQHTAGFSFIHAPKNVTALGYVIEAQNIGAQLLTKLNQLDLTWFQPAQVTTLTQQQNHIELTLDSGKRLCSQLVLACDGANGKMRQLLKLQPKADDYGQWAITSNVEVDCAHQNIAYERFTQNGPLAMLPMKHNRFGLVWCTTQAKAEQLKQLNDDEFIAQLQQAVGYKVGKVIKVGQRQTYPLKRSYLEQNVHHRLVFLGNASHTVHPIAGQGFNLGIRDVACAANLIAQKLTQKQDVGLNWHCYLAERQKDIQFILQTTDTLVNVFSNNQTLLKAARNIGLLAFELSPIAKSAFASRAMGQINLNDR